MKMNFQKYTAPMFACLAVSALLMTGCANSEEHRSGMDDPKLGNTDRKIAHPGTYDNSTVAPTDQVDEHFDTRQYTEEGGLIIRDVHVARTPATTPAEERAYATNDLNAIRAPLMGELARVRDRLNDGDRPEAAAKADQARAAELAQGLEFVNHAMTAIEESTDLTWKTVRESQLKEVEDMREWLKDYRAERPRSKARK